MKSVASNDFCLLVFAEAEAKPTNDKECPLKSQTFVNKPTAQGNRVRFTSNP